MSLAAPVRAAEAAGFVLAGGQSSRMGADKALLLLDGQPLIAHTLEILRQVGLSASIAGARSELAAYGAVIRDPAPDLGPLSGICAALESCSERYAAFLPVDLPFVPAALLQFLLEQARASEATAALVSLKDFAETFPLVVDRAALPVLRRELEGGRGGCLRALKAAEDTLQRPVKILPIEPLTENGQIVHPDRLAPDEWFMNLNTPEDLRHAEQICSRRHPIR